MLYLLLLLTIQQYITIHKNVSVSNDMFNCKFALSKTMGVLCFPQMLVSITLKTSRKH